MSSFLRWDGAMGEGVEGGKVEMGTALLGGWKYICNVRTFPPMLFLLFVTLLTQHATILNVYYI